MSMIPVLTNKVDLSHINVSSGAVALIHKPEAWTSFDVVKKIRSALRLKKVGHGGTLDPFATGLMTIGIERGTKELTALSGLPKTYHAIIRFGMVTDSYDRTGEILSEKRTDLLQWPEILANVKEMSGILLQVPPMYSAKHVNGVRLYKLARKKLEVEREARPVEILKAEILNWDNPYLTIVLQVSKGTYIRSYAHDLGQRLKTGACLQELERTAIDRYRLEDSFGIDEFISTYRKLDGSFTRA